MSNISPEVDAAAFSTRTESKDRDEVAARRSHLEESMRSEGASEAMIERLATDETAQKMLAYEKQCRMVILGMFGHCE